MDGFVGKRKPVRKSRVTVASRRVVRRSTFRRRRRAVARSGFRRTPRAVVIRPIGGFPLRALTTHRYCALGTQTTNLASLTNYVFFANSMYDPEQAIGGHQPMGYDQYSALYSSYSVLSSSILVELWPQDNSDLVFAGTMCAMHMPVPWVAGSPTVPTALNTILESSGTKHAIIGQGSRVTALRYKWNCRQDFDAASQNDNVVQLLAAGTAAYPPKNCGYVLTLVSADAVNTCDVSFRVTITYKALWTQPRSMDPS